ncbi:hypothetical protein CR513_22345, partial [Mucuna pruriens]
MLKSSKNALVGSESRPKEKSVLGIAKNMKNLNMELRTFVFTAMKTQKLQLIELDEDEKVTVVEEAGHDEGNLHISLHAIEGVEGTTFMRLQGQVGCRTLKILIDNGSTHDFLDYDMAKRLGWKENGAELSAVEVAGGKRLDFTKHCDTCAQRQYETVATPGLLQPLHIPNLIWVIIDHMSKYAHFVALSHPYTAATLAQHFKYQIYRIHRALMKIISDRDPVLVSNFWNKFLITWGLNQNSLPLTILFEIEDP